MSFGFIGLGLGLNVCQLTSKDCISGYASMQFVN